MEQSCQKCHSGDSQPATAEATSVSLASKPPPNDLKPRDMPTHVRLATHHLTA